MSRHFRILGLVLLYWALGTPAYAGLIGSSVKAMVQLGNGPSLGANLCKNAFQSGVQVGTGAEVGATDFSVSPDCLVADPLGLTTLDIEDNRLVIGGVLEGGFGDYTWLQIAMTFTGAPDISGVSLSSQNLFQDLGDKPAPSTLSTVDSITLTWDSTKSQAGVFVLADGGTAVFDVQTQQGGAVPEPDSLALLGAALVDTFVALRKRA